MGIEAQARLRAEDSRIIKLASAVISKSSRECPADSMLRQELRREQRLPAEAASLLSRSVFSYFRWLGWLEKGQPLEEQITEALELADTFANQPGRFSDSELVARTVPGWVKSEVEITPEWARSLQTEPSLWLRARPGQGTAVAKELGQCETCRLGYCRDILRYFGTDDLFRSPAFHAGRFEIQDLSSQAVSFICDPRPGEVWWDACSGEGGKTLHLSDLMENKGLIWASDRAAWRLQKLKHRAARAGVFNYRSAIWNGSTRLPTKTRFDGVLVDAPCSGIGTWQRNPHARWTTTPQDVIELSLLQKRLISNAAAAVKTGGKIYYAVCTLARSETVEVAHEFETAHRDFTRLQIENPFEPEKNASKELWLWPQDHMSNGMYVAGWVRN